ncbi:bifunctional diguanylate cyclase/phosphodiesterase [Herbaspirillum sp. ST 5-3]|uniref:sensor domain-containing protein n=1 Tax=Oxalobacteraceae TaxID=75682 RepID=UPI0010A51A86|nr:bifunctional diguanylate cyclase/phosphodiesterase [Herbaspirillum sp. ST 5-3]
MTVITPGARSVQEITRRLADRAAMIVWETDLQGRCTYLNPSAMQGLADPGQVSFTDWQRFMHPDDRASATRAILDARQHQREYQVKYRLQCSDGSTRWIMETAAPRFAPDGRLSGYFGTIVDVSVSHDAVDRLARSELEHRLMTEFAGDMISHSDADNVYVYVSPSHKDTLGYEAHELIGTHVYDYIHPDDLKEDAKRTPAQRRALVNIRFRHKNGHWVWLGATTRTIRDPHTGVKLGIVSVARDITAQIEAEQELRRREERFRSLTTLSSDWYWETDTALRFTVFSEGVLDRLGIHPEELLGTSITAHVKDQSEPGLLAALEAMAERKPFHDLLYPAELAAYPGVVRYLRISGEPFSENGVFCGYRGVSRDVTREVRTARALERLATCDVLTELPNRARLQERLKERLDAGCATMCQAVLFIDLDDFKEVNDSLGHAAGDMLLKEVAARLRQLVRVDDMVARLGGDEFVVLAECKYGERSAVRLAEKLCEAVDKPIVIAGYEVKVSASVGVALYPRDGASSDILLQNADTALYRAKASGGNCYCLFTPEMGAASRSRMLLQGALRHALSRKEFDVHYQPRVELATGEITGMEALLRWNHPELGPISPNEFIPLAEESGLIDEIGAWVLQHATRQAQQWSEHFRRPLRISVNLSARQLRSQKLLTTVIDALRDSGLPASRLELELTETALMEDPEQAAGLLKELKGLGLRLAVDDFGTGYSSLSYLCRFPLDSLKLDRSFLLQARPEDAGTWKLAEAIITLAHALQLSVVAEGVETQQHLDFLRTTSCDEIQGACISHPLPVKAIERLLQAGTRCAQVVA